MSRTNWSAGVFLSTYPVAPACRERKIRSGVWQNYDFVKGSTVGYTLDLDSEQIGRFPAKQLEFVNGTMQIVERNGARALEIANHSRVRVMLPDSPRDGFYSGIRIQGISRASATHHDGGHKSIAQHGGLRIQLRDNVGNP